MSRQARHHARPRGRNHARDDGRARPHQPHRRREQLQRVVRKHHRDTVELLAYRYLPSDDPEAIRTVIAQKERQIGKLRDEVERLRRILPKQDTGTPENRYTEKPRPA